MAIIRSYGTIPDDVSPFEGTISARTSSSFRVAERTSVADWTGTSLAYDGAGDPKSGNLTALDWKIGGKLTIKITGMNAGIPAVNAAFDAPDGDPSDVLFARADTFYGHNGADSIGLAGGNDTYYGYSGNDYLDDTGSGNDKLYGGLGSDTLWGGSGADLLDGDSGYDKLYGQSGSDTLKAGIGNDRLEGGTGTDKLYGGAGTDRFVFITTSESVRGAARDVIADFSRAEGDKIDLSAIDANGTVTGNGTFSFVGSDTFGGTRAELRYASGVVSGDVNGDRVADFEIRVFSATPLVKTDFIL